jgi:nucleoside 2-deoxyribosyltransferase
MKTIYLACPYTHESPEIMVYRYAEVTRVTAELMMDGYNVFSPITHSHPIADWMPHEFQTDADFWLDRDLKFLDVCDELWVLCLGGWKESRGVAREILSATKQGKNIIYLEPNTKEN